MINLELKEKIKDFYEENPIAIGKKAKSSDVKLIKDKLKLELDEDYIDFITSFGGGVLGSYEIYSISNSEILGDESIIDLNYNFKKDDWDGMRDWFIFGSDGSGNPIGIDTTGKIMSDDHDFSGIYTVADSFQEYLKNIIFELDDK